MPDIRTVPAATLYGPTKGTATRDEFQDVRSTLSRLTGGQEDDPYGDCARREVWKADFSELTERSHPVVQEVLILHYNPLNGMAMTALVTPTRRKESPIVTEIKSSPILRNRRAQGKRILIREYGQQVFIVPACEFAPGFDRGLRGPVFAQEV